MKKFSFNSTTLRTLDQNVKAGPGSSVVHTNDGHATCFFCVPSLGMCPR